MSPDCMDRLDICLWTLKQVGQSRHLSSNEVQTLMNPKIEAYWSYPSIHPPNQCSIYLHIKSALVSRLFRLKERLDPQSSILLLSAPLSYNPVCLPKVRQLNYMSSKAKIRLDDTMFAIYIAIFFLFFPSFSPYIMWNFIRSLWNSIFSP